MYVKLLGLKHAKQYQMATVRATNGAMQIEGDVPPEIREELQAIRKGIPNDETFLKQLVMNFSGTYVRAQLVQD